MVDFFFGSLRGDVAEVAHQHRDNVILQILGFFGGDFGQILVGDRRRIATGPDIFALRIRMNAMGDELLAVGQEFDLLRTGASGTTKLVVNFLNGSSCERVSRASARGRCGSG